MQCNICNSWVHVKCNNWIPLTTNFFNVTMILDAVFLVAVLPWHIVDLRQLFPIDLQRTIIANAASLERSSRLFLKPPPNLSLLFNLFNNSTPENSSHTDNVDSKCYDIEEIKKLKTIDRKKSPSVVHINACSFSNNFQDLEHLLKCTNKSFDIIVISETRITKATSQLCNINLKNYCNLN